MAKYKALEPLISSILLILVAVILIIMMVSFGKDTTNKNLEKVNDFGELKSSDATSFVYPKNFNNGILQFNFYPPKNLYSENIIIIKYKILEKTSGSQSVTLNTEYILKEGLNILELNDFENLNISNNRIDIELETNDNKFILLKNITYLNIENINNVETEVIPEDNSIFFFGEAINFKFSNGQSEINCSWDSNIDGDIGEACDFNIFDLNVGAHQIILTVNYGTETETRNIDLIVKQHLQAEILSPDSEIIISNGFNVSFIGSVDYNYGEYTCSWDSNIDGALGNDCELDINDLNIGEHTITFEVTDDLETQISQVLVTIIEEYNKVILFDHSKVAATLFNFPALIKVTDSDLLEHAQSDASDIYFLSSNGIKLKKEIESYNPVTGELVAWVNIPVLSSTVDTEIYMYFGNSEVNESNDFEVWDNNYKGIWHLKNISGTLNVQDSTQFSNHGTLSSSAPQAGTGTIDGAGTFNGTNNYIAIPSAVTSGLNRFTVSFWVKTTESKSSSTNWQRPTLFGQTTEGLGTNDFTITTNDGYIGMLSGLDGTDLVYLSSSTRINDDSWHYVVATYSGSSIKLYVDNVYEGTLNANLSMNSQLFWIAACAGASSGYSTVYHSGIFDEVRVSDTNRSEAWIETEYNNQNSPETFYTVGLKPKITSPITDSFQYYQNLKFTSTIVNNNGEYSCLWSSNVDGNLGINCEEITVDLSLGAHTITLTVTDQLEIKTDTIIVNIDDGYNKSILFDRSKVVATLSNFPVLIKITDSDLLQYAQSNASDIYFLSSNRLKLKREIESYNSVTGELVAWVKIPELSSVTDTQIYINYGGTGISESNDTNVWDNDYKGVWHLKNISGTLNVQDSTQFSNHGTFSSSAPVVGIGTIDGAGTFNGTNNYVAIPSVVTSGLNRFTMSFWVKTTENKSSTTYWQRPTLFGQTTAGAGSNDFAITTNNGYIGMISGLNGTDLTYLSSTKKVNDSSWHYIVATYDGSSIKLYVDNVYEGTLNANLSMNSQLFWIAACAGASSSYATVYHSGIFDEVRVSNINRSEAWIETEFNNQNSPETFYILE